MNIKAIIFDLDGTAIPNRNDGMPSQELINIVAEAQKTVKVSVATGRPISNCRHILKALNITSPCIIAGGTQIINPKTEETLWKKELSKEQVKKIIEVCSSYDYQIFISDEEESSTAKEKQITSPEQVVYIMTVTGKDTPVIIERLHQIPNIIAHEVRSHTSKHFDIHITHVEATKKHALEELLKIENVKEKNVMAVGDSNNDLPLFQVAGYKVAMGNATDKLKTEADYVTASVEEDGLAQVIKKTISIPFSPMLENSATRRRMTNFFDQKITPFLKNHGVSILRVCLGIVFLWFGTLKLANFSPVTDLIRDTYPFVPTKPFVIILGIWETAIGLGLIFKIYLRTTLVLLWLQMAGTFFSIVLAPSIFFQNGNPLLLTTMGEFVIKNLVLAASSLAIGGKEILAG